MLSSNCGNNCLSTQFTLLPLCPEFNSGRQYPNAALYCPAAIIQTRHEDIQLAVWQFVEVVITIATWWYMTENFAQLFHWVIITWESQCSMSENATWKCLQPTETDVLLLNSLKWGRSDIWSLLVTTISATTDMSSSHSSIDTQRNKHKAQHKSVNRGSNWLQLFKNNFVLFDEPPVLLQFNVNLAVIIETNLVETMLSQFIHGCQYLL